MPCGQLCIQQDLDALLEGHIVAFGVVYHLVEPVAHRLDAKLPEQVYISHE